MPIRETARHAERTANRHVLAEQVHGRVAFHFLVERTTENLDEGGAHGTPPVIVAMDSAA